MVSSQESLPLRNNSSSSLSLSHRLAGVLRSCYLSPVTLSDLASEGLTHLNVTCAKCDRRGRYGIARAIAAHGDVPAAEFLSIVSRSCPKRTAQSVYDWCGAIYAPDSRSRLR